VLLMSQRSQRISSARIQLTPPSMSFTGLGEVAVLAMNVGSGRGLGN
jgi:hypothetical protein